MVLGLILNPFGSLPQKRFKWHWFTSKYNFFKQLHLWNIYLLLGIEQDIQVLEDVQDEYDFKRNTLQSRGNIRHIFSISLLVLTHTLWYIWLDQCCEHKQYESTWMRNGMDLYFIFSVEVEMNGQITKEIQLEEMAIKQMFVGLSMKREVGQDFSNISLHTFSWTIELRNIFTSRNVFKVCMKQKLR